MPEFSMCKLDKQDELFFVVTKKKIYRFEPLSRWWM